MLAAMVTIGFLSLDLLDLDLLNLDLLDLDLLDLDLLFTCSTSSGNPATTEWPLQGGQRCAAALWSRVSALGSPLSVVHGLPGAHGSEQALHWENSSNSEV